MFHDLFNLNRWQRKSRCIGLVLLKYCVRLEERIDADKTLSQDQKEKMQLAIDQALAALGLVNNGHEYDRNNPNDPVKQAETALKEFFAKREHIPIPEDEVPKDRLSVATQMIKEKVERTYPSPSTKYPIHVRICDSGLGTVDPISETVKYAFSGTSYTLDDLLYCIRLCCPNAKLPYPYFYCRQVKAHRLTQEGSKFDRRKASDSLMGLPISGAEDVGVVYLIPPQPKFTLLVKGVPFAPGGQNEDSFYIVSRFNEPTTKAIADGQTNSKRRTFHHISEASWNYVCEPDIESKLTWKYHKDKRQLTAYEGEWIVCIE